MRLRYRISRLTTANAKNLERRIISQLEKGNYNILSKNNGEIVFDDLLGSTSKSNYYKMVNHGTIKVMKDDNCTVTYIYDISINFEFVLCLLIIGFAVFSQILELILLLLGVILQFIVKLRILKEQGIALMDYVAWSGHHYIDLATNLQTKGARS
ncbi:hypothetical protein DHW03_11745 [Pedobacter yonginense]|uniref:Uncharacterized protein n=1 Tax=Pedobacter yonginense TaxID=651869 RepID=A0A317EJ70_9SPHI|nr:hypothetical protein [Pedobacter yonginense]PWS26702.1 hypothetical protein DHW03_11745 [Pedobacter yonginense]